MPKISLQALGRLLAAKRGTRALRDVATEIGVSPATLSRVEHGNLPDLETFGKICSWLKIDPGEVLGIKRPQAAIPQAAVHFRKDKELEPTTAQALAKLILHVQRTLLATESPDAENE